MPRTETRNGPSTRAALVSLALLASALLGGCSGDPGSNSASAAPLPNKIGHVFIVILENENADTTFGPGSPAPYLAQTLTALGAFVPNYYGTGHLSLDNYISMVSGQSPNSQTQSDCNYYADFVLANPTQTAPDEEGQVTGQGCVYPAFVKTIGDQLEAVGLNWREYAQDMGADASRDNGSPTCSHPALTNPPTQDKTQTANATDQYAARHNPFMYFHSIIDNQANCDARVVELGVLDADLATVATTPNYVFITPDLCNDGHDAPCKDGGPGGLTQVNTFLQTLVPKILNSPAFKQDGLLIVTFDEAEFSQNDPAGSDVTACCNEPGGPNTTTPGIGGAGGGRVGAVLISPLIKPGTVVSTDYAYNHYSMLRSVEDLFGLPYLGYAGQASLKAFGPEIFNNTNP